MPLPVGSRTHRTQDSADIYLFYVYERTRARTWKVETYFDNITVEIQTVKSTLNETKTDATEVRDRENRRDNIAPHRSALRAMRALRLAGKHA